jgi:hypothetical protein
MITPHTQVTTMLQSMNTSLIQSMNMQDTYMMRHAAAGTSTMPKKRTHTAASTF